MSSTFRVGDRVRIPLGRRRFLGVVTEDRGAIGLRGRHLYQVSVSFDPFEPATFELPGDEIEPIEESAESGASLDPDRIKNYLINGGLIAILQSNLSGGRHQPRVWLRPDSVGNITYTFEKERGVVGGEVVPDRAIYDEKIFTPKRDEVLSFLQGFRLELPDAEQVLASIGTAP